MGDKDVQNSELYKEVNLLYINDGSAFVLYAVPFLPLQTLCPVKGQNGAELSAGDCNYKYSLERVAE
ncbi:Hypothetical predicted protein, partial [Paramuricea clavata]